MDSETDCKCIKVVGHLEDVKWLLYPREYCASRGPLALADWTGEPHIWMHYVESATSLPPEDDVLKSTDTRYTGLHDVQRYLVAQLHCETVLFTSQYPNLRLRTPLGSYLWRANTALKLPPKLYLKEFHTSLEVTLKKMEHDEVQMDRLIISDWLIKIERLDYFKRKTFFRILGNIISVQRRLQLVSLENLCCRRLEGARLLQQLACFSAHSLKYLFLWRFVLPNENPLIINYSYITEQFLGGNCEMTSQEEKSRLAKLLDNLEVPEVNLTERCHELVKEFHAKYDQEVEEEEQGMQSEQEYKNPYVVDEELLKETERKLRELLAQSKRSVKAYSEKFPISSGTNKPWRTNSCKEKLMCIDMELQRHHHKSSGMIEPLESDTLQGLLVECTEEGEHAGPVTTNRVLEVVHAARRDLPNFHGQYLPRPSSRHCFLRSLAQLTGLRVLALEHSHLADGSGSALLALLPVLKRPHFKLQLICREDQVPGRADAALGAGGYDIPDTAWRKVAFACPDLYVTLAFFRIRDYDNIRRFLSPSVPLRELHVQYGIDLLRRQRQDSDVGCLLRHAAHFFKATLVCVSIQQWRGATFPLRRVVQLLPRLARLRYAGRVRAAADLRDALEIVACGVCDRLKQLVIQIQDEEETRAYWRQVVYNLAQEFKEIMNLYNVVFCLSVYKT